MGLKTDPFEGQDAIQSVIAKSILDTTRKQDNMLPDTCGHLISKNVRLNGRRTSVRLEPEMWQALSEIASMEKSNIHALCTKVALHAADKSSFTAALRVFLMNYYRNKYLKLMTIQNAQKAQAQKTGTPQNRHYLLDGRDIPPGLQRGYNATRPNDYNNR